MSSATPTFDPKVWGTAKFFPVTTASVIIIPNEWKQELRAIRFLQEEGFELHSTRPAQGNAHAAHLFFYKGPEKNGHPTLLQKLDDAENKYLPLENEYIKLNPRQQGEWPDDKQEARRTFKAIGTQIRAS